MLENVLFADVKEYAKLLVLELGFETATETVPQLHHKRIDASNRWRSPNYDNDSKI